MSATQKINRLFNQKEMNMYLSKNFFESGTFKLKEAGRIQLKEFFKAQEIKKINGLIGYTPDPENPWPCPGPWPWPERTSLDLGGGSKLLSGLLWTKPYMEQNVFRTGYFGKPGPDDVDPWPWPLGPLVRDLLSESILERIGKSPLREKTFDFIDVIKRENIALDALSELREDLSVVQHNLSAKIEKLG